MPSLPADVTRTIREMRQSCATGIAVYVDNEYLMTTITRYDKAIELKLRTNAPLEVRSADAIAACLGIYNRNRTVCRYIVVVYRGLDPPPKLYREWKDHRDRIHMEMGVDPGDTDLEEDASDYDFNAVMLTDMARFAWAILN